MWYTGLLFGAILGHFTTLDIFLKLELSEKYETELEINNGRPDMWLERHNNLNSELIQLKRKAQVKDDTARAMHRNLKLLHPLVPIQPLVENTLWHGINDTEKSNWSLHLEAYENNNTLEITATDDGKGLPKKEEEKVKQRHKSFGL